MRKLPTITRAEWLRVSLFAVFVIILTTLPYILGWLRAGADWQFGGFLFGADDGYTYLSKMRLGARGEWLFTIRYTSEEHEGALLLLTYIALGHVTRLFVAYDDPNLTGALAITYHVARILFDFGLILITYRFVAVFLRRPATRALTLLLIILGGGLGWLVTLIGLGHWLGSLPVDFFVPEAYSFLILFGLPHLALARSMLLLGFVLFFQSLLTSNHPRQWLRYTVPAGVCWMIVGLVVPFYITLLYLILGSWGLVTWRHDRRFPWALFWRAVSAAVVPVPVLTYTAVVFLTNEILGEWAAQNRLPSPHIIHYVLGYVVFAALAIRAVGWAWQRKPTQEQWPYLLLVTWIMVAPIAVYLPVTVQRRLAESVIVPLSILTVAGLRLSFPTTRRYRRARNGLLALTLPTAALLWLGATFSVLNPDRPLFRPQAEIDAFRALDAAAPSDAVVLSTQPTGNVLAAFTDLIAYIGHGPETINSDTKAERAEQFFAGELSPEEQHALLSEVDYVFYGPLEKPDEADATAQWTTELIRLPSPDPDYTIYEVRRD